MKFYEISEPYYALIKARSGEEAVKKYIEVVAGDESEFEILLEDCKLVPDYYASARFAQSRDEKGNLMDFDEVIEILESNETEILIMDGSLL
ncbi:hypothetical protein GCM10011391_28250 [Pullulanibacillus camelliae]|uniref:Uncharacterized protein n=1 Tax=Pullulanibacillus camelliae TaxID=1707096 RepID=A0A8J3DXD0_9BACL|nr:hypothetical protein [Pullulanibacillus camelliae]GGE47847.1 hypothetical protein GCM10011391_28250 [Pullulanibacillus camelliae]